MLFFLLFDNLRDCFLTENTFGLFNMLKYYRYTNECGKNYSNHTQEFLMEIRALKLAALTLAMPKKSCPLRYNTVVHS